MTAAVLAGLLIGVAYTLSPLSVWFAVGGAALIALGGRGLPPRERRWIRGLLVAAIGIRAALAAALFLFGSADHMWFNTFFGDEQYVIVRSLRLRTLWLDGPISREALFDVFDMYGQTSYLNMIAYVQLLVGPAPYGIHLLNAVVYLAGAILLHRLVRTAFGRVSAFCTFVGVLFYPTLVVWSSSALKESINFLVVTCVIAAAVAIVRAPWTWRPAVALGIVAGLATLATFRAGAVEIMVLGLCGGFAGRFLTRRTWRLAAAALVVVVAAAPVVHHPRVQAAALVQLRQSAQRHMGHVFTRGHSYKLLDEQFYRSYRSQTMSWEEAKRFVRRAMVSVLLFPAPWHAQSWSELAYVPEQVVWYLVLASAIVGFAAGLRRDALVTCILAAYAIAALAVVSLNTGNIGTLVRHRSFALPYLIALSAIGVTTLLARSRAVTMPCQ
jgi:hypothetical protein